jgi:putative intracellular protease/amidase
MNMIMSPLSPRLARALFASGALASLLSLSAPAATQAAPTPALRKDAPASSGTIAPYQARFGRNRPVIAILGENSGSELNDFVIPYGVLEQSGVAEVVTVSTQPGVLKLRPALTLQAQATIQEFDARFPDGADYVIVPAIVRYKDPVLLAWIVAQAAKGGTVMSICDGAVVVAASGLMNGHRATAHWASQGARRKYFPEVKWVDNVRYVADGKIISTSGLSAAIPASLALVEAIAGHDRTLALATELGVSDWSPQHNTKPFRPRFGVNLWALISVNYTNAWFHPTDTVGVPLTPGMDEIALALTADAYSRTGRSQAYALAASASPVQTRYGLVVIPDRVVGGANPVKYVLPAFDATPSGRWLAKSIDGIMLRYGRTTAYGVALDFEYPMIPQRSLAKAHALPTQ